MRKIRNLLFLLLITAVCALTLASCGSDAELSLLDEAMPQLVYVLGDELDLSGGRLQVKDGDEITEIAMTDEGVTVSGFDSNKLGEQTVTLSYGGSSVTLTVTVVEKVQALDVTTDYLVGDGFNLSTGKLKITRDDGSSYTVVLNNEKVSVTGFDSSKAGSCPVTVTYSSGSETFTLKLDTTVHAIEDVSFTPPSKITYKSHDGGIDLTGGILTLEGKGGELKRDVAITEGMISDFDLGAVDEQTSPLDQTVKVTYLGHSFSYGIKITYTGVTKFIENAPAAAGLDFSKDFNVEGVEEPKISEELGELTVELMTIYNNMSPAERVLIPKDTVLSVARCAMLYSLNVWGEDVGRFEGAFEFSEGALALTCESAEAVAAVVEKLKDKDSPLFTLPPVMAGIVDILGEEIFFYEYLFGDFAVADVEALKALSDLFEYMLELDTLADEIPDDWATEGSESYGTQIEALYDRIINGEYAGYDFAQIYYGVSKWRTDDDLFDILYDYYYKAENTSALVSLALIRLPHKLEEIFAYILAAMENMDDISNGAMYDTSQFFYNYSMALKLSDELKASDDEMMKMLYAALPLNGLLGVNAETLFYFDYMMTYLRTAEGGFYASSGPLLGLPEYSAVMDKYINVVMAVFADEGYTETEQYKQDLEQMLALYFELSPAQQFNFLGMLNALYAGNIPEYAFDPVVKIPGEDADYDLSCVFVSLLQEHYESLFSNEEAAKIYVTFMVATEAYAQRYTSEKGLQAFIDKMAEVKAIFDGMSDADQGVFTEKLGSVYAEYLKILNYVDPPVTDPDAPEEPSEPEFGDWADEFASLKEAMLAVDLSYQLLQGGYNYYSLYFSAFERAQSIAQNIVNKAPAEIVNLYYNEGLYSTDELGSILDPDAEVDKSGWVYWSYDYVISVYRAVYVNIQLTLAQGESIYDFYVSENMADFLDAAYDIIWALMWSDEEATEKTFDPVKVHAALAEFRKLSPAAKILFASYMEAAGGDSLYYTALDEFIKEHYTGKSAEVATGLINIEMTYLVFWNTGEAEDLELLKGELKELKDAYEALVGDEKADFADFETGYLKIVTMIEQAIAEAEAEDPSTENA